jgi:3'(2'), 5'-bisphosphate nucleotidase
MTTIPREFLDGPLSQMLRAVDQAAQLATWIRRHRVVALEKPDRTPLTIADLAAQAVVSAALERVFPDDLLVAEEDASVLDTDKGRRLVEPLIQHLRPFLPALDARELTRLLTRARGSAGPRAWFLDPVDGTEGFLHDGRHYVVALALIDRGHPTVGILGCPTLQTDGMLGGPVEHLHTDIPGSMLVAQRDRGVWVSPLEIAEFTAVRVSDVTSVRDARLLRSYVDSHIDVDATRAFERAAAVAQASVPLDSQAKHALIAAGHADLFVRMASDPRYREQIWDHAAGVLAIEEAGGRVTDLHGRPLDFAAGTTLSRNEGIVASNGHLHAAALAAVDDALASTTRRRSLERRAS